MQGMGPVAEEQPNRVQVVVRVRPVLPHELSDEVAVTCSPDARKLQVLLPDRFSGGTGAPGGSGSGTSGSRGGARSYEFDACLAGSTSQEDLFEVCGMQELVDAALDGYCVTIFAFGQTGSGKTHTIIGPRLSRGAGGEAAGAGSAPAAAGGSGGASGTVLVDTEDGVLTRCVAAAYRSMEARSAASGVEWGVSASVVELYNEAVTDLLGADKSKQLQVRKDVRDGFAVVGLTQAPCPSASSALRCMVRALQHRHTRGHRLNEYSSRSHCIMTFVFASKEAPGQGGAEGAKGGVRRYGKLCLVDLAGSERLKETGNTERGAVRETGAINKSLFTLGQVLAALSARSIGSSSSSFVPYRDSKLTQLLWDGLRGSGRCLMLACLGPMRGAAEESLNTLHFASLATRIKAEPVVLLDPQDQLVLDLRKTISALRQENAQLAGALQQLSLGADPAAVMGALPEGLRASAAAAAAAMAAGAGPKPPLPGPPGASDDAVQDALGTPPRPGRLQPLAGSSGRSLASSLDASSSTIGVEPLDGPMAAPSLSAASPMLPASGRPPRIAVSQGPSQGGAVDGLAHIGASSGPAPRSAPAPLAEPHSPALGHAPRVKHAWGTPTGTPGSSGNSRKQLLPDGPLYGRASSLPSRLPPPPSADSLPSRHGTGVARHTSRSPKRKTPGRSRPMGRGGAAATAASGGGAGSRPAYLTADPTALLYGFSTALPPVASPPTSAGSAAAAGTSLATAPPLRAATDLGLAPPPPPALSEFPELAAMEAEFQQLLAAGGRGTSSGSATAGASAAAGRGRGDGKSNGNREGNGGSGGGSVPAEEERDEGPHPEVRALKWAERNGWFGTDFDMTAYAYQVHDQLVAGEHVDPTSDLYYMEIERRVAERFPDKWAAHMRGQLPGGSGAAAVAAVRRAAPSPGRLRTGEPPQQSPPRRASPTAAPPSPAPHFGAGLRVNLKEPLHRSPSARRGGDGGGDGGATDAAAAASLAAQAAEARARQAAGAPDVLSFSSLAPDVQLPTPLPATAPPPPQQLLPKPRSRIPPPPPQPASSLGSQFNQAYSLASQTSTPASSQVSSHAGPGSGFTTPGTPATSSDTAPSTPGAATAQHVNPFNIGALHAAAPPRASRFAPVPGRGRGMVLLPRGTEADAVSAERIAREYARQRAAVVEELRVAKEEALMDRQQILARLHRAAGAGKWR